MNRENIFIRSSSISESWCCTDQPSSILNFRRPGVALPLSPNFNVVIAFGNLSSEKLENEILLANLEIRGRGGRGGGRPQTPTTPSEVKY